MSNISQYDPKAKEFVRMTRHPVATVLLGFVLLAESPVTQGSTVRDPRDQKNYPVVEIAGMAWMGRNLAYAATGSSCPDGSPERCEDLGRLYPWAVAVDACPAGWHLSTELEWQALETSLGMAAAELENLRERGPGLGDSLKPGGSSRLEFPLAGWRRPDGSYAVGNGRDVATAIWTATRAGEDEAWHRDLSSARTGIWRSPVSLDYSLSVRCVKN